MRNGNYARGFNGEKVRGGTGECGARVGWIIYKEDGYSSWEGLHSLTPQRFVCNGYPTTQNAQNATTTQESSENAEAQTASIIAGISVGDGLSQPLKYVDSSYSTINQIRRVDIELVQIKNAYGTQWRSPVNFAETLIISTMLRNSMGKDTDRYFGDEIAQIKREHGSRKERQSEERWKKRSYQDKENLPIKKSSKAWKGVKKEEEEEMEHEAEGNLSTVITEVRAKLRKEPTGDNLERALAPLHEHCRRMNNDPKISALEKKSLIRKEMSEYDFESEERRKKIQRSNHDDDDKENVAIKNSRKAWKGVKKEDEDDDDEKLDEVDDDEEEKRDGQDLSESMRGVRAKLRKEPSGLKLELALAPLHAYYRRIYNENKVSMPPTKSLFRMPKEVLDCDFEDESFHGNQRRIYAYMQYEKELQRIEPKVRQIIEVGLRRQYGATFERQFPDWNKPESSYKKKFKERLDVYRMALTRHYFYLKQVPAFFYDWRGTQDVETIPGGVKLIDGDYKTVQLWEGSKGGPEHIADYLKKDYHKLPTCTCRDSCSNESGCACFEKETTSLKRLMAVHVNGRLQYQDGRPLGAVKRMKDGEFETIDDIRTPLSRFEKNNPPHAFLCDKTCGCSESCPNRRILKDGCPSILAIVNLPGKGLGVLAVDRIERGTFIAAYAGEWMREEEANRQRRDRSMYAGIPTYSDLVISPDLYYNIYKFINHACCPNVTMTMIMTDRLAVDWGELTIHARQTIHPGEEIESDYGLEYKMYECRCGFAQCRKRLGFE